MQSFRPSEGFVVLKATNTPHQPARPKSVFKPQFTMDTIQADKSIYQALDATISEIRVLILHQGSGDQGLRCTLKTVSLNDQPAFHALSYVWGSNTEGGHIKINGHVVRVTSNLATVLTQFCSHHYDFLQLHSIPLWIDALCINQANLEERTQQVLLMGRIYRQASRVLLWIGDGDESSDHAFDRMGDATFRAYCRELKTTTRVPTLDEIKVKIIIADNLEERRYWKRTWIFQEVVLATQDPVMLCGSRRIFWSWYTQCKRDLPNDRTAYPSLASEWATVDSQVPLHQDHDSSRPSHTTNHEIFRDYYWRYGPLPLANLLIVTTKLGATDPRDLVYGALGLIPHRELLRMNIDYQETHERVFRDAMAVVWTSGIGGLISDTMRMFPFGLAIDKSGALPSWVPDFSRLTVHDQTNSILLTAQPRSWRPERQAKIHVEGSILTINAIRFDSIAETTELNFRDGWAKKYHRRKISKTLDIQKLHDIEAMAQRGRNTPIPASSRLAPFLVLRDKDPIWNVLTLWKEDTFSLPGASGGKNDEWLPGVPRDRQKLWEILLGRQQIPEDWKMACSPELRSNLRALEAAVLSPLLFALGRTSDGKKIFVSRSGFLGVGSESVEAGDLVVFIVGMKCMYVLRPFRDGYHMVGFAYMSGLMNWDDLDEAIKVSSLQEEELKIY